MHAAIYATIALLAFSAGVWVHDILRLRRVNRRPQ